MPLPRRRPAPRRLRSGRRAPRGDHRGAGRRSQTRRARPDARRPAPLRRARRRPLRGTARTPALDAVSVRLVRRARRDRRAQRRRKTTLARLLVRFRDPDAGAIEVGGLDVRRATQSDLRREVRLASQDAHLFTTTIRQNVLLANPHADDDAILAALARAGLRDWVAGLPAGLDTAVGEDGAEVSGGQRRRIALARAFVAEARFLVLDEPTAHLDPAGARELLRSLGEDRADTRGVLVISHTVAGLAAFDEIIVLAAGRIAERGTYPALLAAERAFSALAAVA